MNVSLDQVKRGVARYINDKMLPQLTGGKKIALGAYAALAVDGAEKKEPAGGTSPPSHHHRRLFSMTNQFFGVDIGDGETAAFEVALGRHIKKTHRELLS